MSQPGSLAEQRTRQRLLEAANALMAHEGLTRDLLPRTADASGCDLARARVFFQRDEDLVLALYTRLATELEARVLDLPEGTVAERFDAVMRLRLEIAAPHRHACVGLLATSIDPRHELGVLSPQAVVVRSRVLGVFTAVVQGAVDRPAERVPELVRTLYGLHLALLLLWSLDATPGQQSTRAGLDLARDLLAFAGPFLAAPEAATAVGRLGAVFGPLVEPPDDPEVTARAEAILRRLFRHRRLSPDAGPCAETPCERCLALHLPRVRHFLLTGRPLHLLLPAFPAKSPSRRKTLGPLPDRAEEVALEYLRGVCAELAELHPAGVRLTICSDGHVFSDLVGVTDDEVSAYGRGVRAMLTRLGTAALDTFDMADLYETDDFEAMRRHLVAEYARPTEEIVERARQFTHHRLLFNGIHRFLFEEQADVQIGRSRTSVREECKERAYEVIRRSDAWGRLIADCFPHALRLSIHPQHPHAEKIGVLLGAADDAWQTPWHGVALRHSGEWKFVKRHEAESLGARLVQIDGRPSHFELEGPS